MPQHKCPDDLGTLILVLDPILFDMLPVGAVTLSDIRKLMGDPRKYFFGHTSKRLGSELKGAELAELNLRTMFQHMGWNETVERLFSYGNNREGIIRALNEELDGCEKCRGEYDRLLDQVVALSRLPGSSEREPYKDRTHADKDFLRRYQTR
jgi:hypothetical protein